MMRCPYVFLVLSVCPRSFAAEEKTSPPPPRYTITDIGPADADHSIVAINNKGQIAGNEDGKAFVWTDGKKAFLLRPVRKWRYPVVDINDEGDVAGNLDPGEVAFYNDEYPHHAVLWRGNRLLDLTKGSTGETIQQAVAMNNKGVVVGDGLSGACVWHSGKVESMPSVHQPLALQAASAINDNDWVIGVSASVEKPELSRGFLGKDGTVTDLGTLGGDVCRPTAINNNGQIVGRSSTKGESPLFAFLWDNGKMTNLGTLPGDRESAAVAVNESGDVLGNSGKVIPSLSPDEGRPFLWRKGKMQDLNALIAKDSGWRILSGIDMNNAGQIIGDGLLNGKRHSFLLTPIAGQHSNAANSPR